MKIERPVLLIATAVLFVLDFVFLMARNALEAAVSPGSDIVHSVLFGLALATAAVAFFAGDGAGEHTPVQRMGRLILLAGTLLVMYLVIAFAGVIRYESVNDTMLPAGTSTVVFSILLAIGTALVGLAMFRLLTHLLFMKRKRATRRNYLVLVIASALFITVRYALSLVMAESVLRGNMFLSMLIAMLVMLMVVNAFRFPWIMQLTRREKLATLGMTAAGVTLYTVLAVNHELYEPALHYVHPIVSEAVFLLFLFGAIYTGLGFWSTLLHLPTAREFDRKREEISSFQTMGRLMTQVFDRRELVETAAKLAIHTGDADGGWIELRRAAADDDPARAEGTATVADHPDMYLRNVDAEYLETLQMNEGMSLRELVLQTGKPVIVQDSGSDRRLRRLSLPAPPFGSIALLPLNAHGATIGLLGLVKRSSYEFDKDSQNALAAFADLAAVAIENSRLITESLARERFKQEMTVARTMQQSLLPTLLPIAPTYDIAVQSVPAYEVGGDYYDMVRLDNDRLGIIVGDVSGKGVPAALYMAQVKGLFQSLSRDGAAAREILIRMNAILCESTDRKSFISILYAVLNIRTGTLTFSRAGHCPLLYISGGMPRYMRPNGMGLGLDPSERFSDTIEEETIVLGTDDIIVLYTDGVTEAHDAHGEEFQYERLSDIVRDHREAAADTITTAVVQAVKRHAEPGEAEDDMTIVVLRWKGTEHEHTRKNGPEASGPQSTHGAMV